MTIPKGVKGNSVTDASSIPTIVKAGAGIYDNIACQDPPIEILTDDLPISISNLTYFSKTGTTMGFDDGTGIKYVKLKDTREWHEGFQVTNYDNNSTGTNR